MSIENPTASQLQSQIDRWRPQLLELDPSLIHEKPSPDRWSISEVIGHLIDSACNNHQRFVRAQFCDELMFPKYQQNDWVAAANYRQCEWESLVQLWYHYNQTLAVLIRNISAADLDTPCHITGSDEPTPYDTCTLGFLVSDYLVHLNYHLDKVAQRIGPQNRATQ